MRLTNTPKTLPKLFQTVQKKRGCLLSFYKGKSNSIYRKYDYGEIKAEYTGRSNGYGFRKLSLKQPWQEIFKENENNKSSENTSEEENSQSESAPAEESASAQDTAPAQFGAYSPLNRNNPPQNLVPNIGAKQLPKVNDKSKKVGPNDPCPCGSGKKYKKCCGKIV